MKTTKKISFVVLAGLFSAVASFGLYVLMPYLSGNNGSSINDADSKSASNAKWALHPVVEEQPELVPRRDIVNQVAEVKQYTPEESEESSIHVKNNEGLAPVKAVEEEAEKMPEGRVLAYRGAEGGHPFSMPKGLEEADLIPRLKGVIEEEDEDESREKKGKTKPKNLGGKKDSPTVEPKPLDRALTSSRTERVAGAKVNVSGRDLPAGAQIADESPEKGAFKGEVAQTSTALQTNPAVPTPPSKLRSRVGSNGRIYVGGGWYSNAGAGNVNGAAGGIQNPSSPQRIIFDSPAVKGVFPNRNRQISGLPNGISPRLPTGTNSGLGGFQPGIQNTTNSLQPRSIVPGTSGGGTSTVPGFTLPVVQSGNLPAAGGSDRRINVGGIQLP